MKYLDKRAVVRLLKKAGATMLNTAGGGGVCTVSFGGERVFSHLPLRHKTVSVETYCRIRKLLRRMGVELPPASAVGRGRERL